MRSPNAAKRCLPWALTVSSTRPSTSAASAKRPCGLDDVHDPAGEPGALRPAPGGAACDPRASSVRARRRCRRGPAGQPRRRTCPSARRRWRGRGRTRSRTPAPRRRRGRVRRAPCASASGAWPSTATAGGAAARPRVEARRPTLSAQRGAAMASATPSPPANRRAATCSRICGWASPPIVPNTAASSPSRVAIAGHSVCGGRRPGASSAGWPALQAEAEPAVVDVDAGRRLDEPRAEARRVGLDEADGHPAGVGRAQVRRVAGRRRERAGARPARGRRGRPGPSMAATSAAPSAPSCSTSGRSKPAVAAASTSRWAHAGVVGVRRAAPIASARRAAPRNR